MLLYMTTFQGRWAPRRVQVAVYCIPEILDQGIKTEKVEKRECRDIVLGAVSCCSQ